MTVYIISAVVENSVTKLRDLSGLRFGNLTVVRRDTDRKGLTFWICECVCGNATSIRSQNITAGRTISCGCAKGRHGHTSKNRRTPTYRSWQAMISRCTQPRSAGFHHYKAIGVTICDRWRTFDDFLADMGERPSMEHSLDRYPNKTGNYEPGNCRWATKREQANNRITNVVVYFNGRQMTMAELSRETGLPKELLRHRITRAGWPVEAAVSLPKCQGSRKSPKRRA